MNKVILTGRMTKDADFRTAGESQVARFTLAVDRRFKSEGQPDADFIGCVAFGKTAEFINNHFRKGNKLSIVGRIQTGKYTNKDGGTIFTTDVVTEEVYFGESKKDQETQQAPAPVQQAPAMQQQAPAQEGFIPQQQSFSGFTQAEVEGLPFR